MAGTGEGARSGAGTEALVTATVGRWSASLLRTARLHSLCDDDAHDAYQRALELFLTRASRLDAEKAHRWLHTVVKHESMALRERQLRLLGARTGDAEAGAKAASRGVWGRCGGDFHSEQRP